MSTYPFMQVDAFTDRPLGGNPCAIVFDSDGLSDETMQAIACEMNLAETAFVRQSQVANFGVRYFTPAEEIPLAGHPTIATTVALIKSGRLQLRSEYTAITLELKVGPIQVEIYSTPNSLEQVVMTQKKPEFLAVYEPLDVMRLFSLSAEESLPGAPIQTVSTGTPQLMVPLKDHAALRRARLNINAYNDFRAAADFFSPHLFCLGGATPVGQTFARQFGTPPDLPEDPVTGSGTGCMAAYLWRYGLIDQPKFVAEQGHWMNRPGQVNVEVIGLPAAIETVKVGGSAVVVLQGELML
ncbi:PhzF family phenazine biosynthesis protein [Leptolyngbya sp. FACHB-261]|uniref:PhzF family phenazine biosynthesis protein n=1 Tax=Leptolyngbya sp. FACHB-261 TaxID=2692806 RepID=UPI001683F8AE|nr:PhzF family phenazine biosynthesis protein [Leptolyngbya sp. FACHB-261]MBD2101721.1 PhzF family phenazine biosynthesis protein [Leptolyngbya sp. FACHB-261]